MAFPGYECHMAFPGAYCLRISGPTNILYWNQCQILLINGMDALSHPPDIPEIRRVLKDD